MPRPVTMPIANDKRRRPERTEAIRILKPAISNIPKSVSAMVAAQANDTVDELGKRDVTAHRVLHEMSEISPGYVLCSIRDLLATPFQYLFLTPRLAAPCLLFGRETHASTTQSDPLLLPTQNGPCREDGALHWEYLF